MVKSAFQHAWNGYSSFAYGHDELQPITNGTTDSRYSKDTLQASCYRRANKTLTHMIEMDGEVYMFLGWHNPNNAIEICLYIL